MFLHANMVHLGWNFSMQLIFGKKLFYKKSNQLFKWDHSITYVHANKNESNLPTFTVDSI